VAELFSRQELEDISERANDLASENESDPGLRAALQLFAEAAANLSAKVGAAEQNL
jgi:hypothetical protein